MIVVWRVTERCNLSCPFCAYDRNLKKIRKDADENEILRFGKLLAEYHRKSGNKVLVSWLGGEPLLYKPLLRLDKIFYHNYGLLLSTTTNGMQLQSGEIRTHLINYYSELTVSVDGIGKTHDEVRGWYGGFNALKKQVSNLASRKIKTGKGPLLRANIVLMRNTFEEFESLCREVASWGVEEVTFNQLGGRERPEFYQANRLLKNQAEHLLEEFPFIRARLARIGLKLKGSLDYISSIRASSMDKVIAREVCNPGRHFLFIDEKGIVAPCSFTLGECGIPLKQIQKVSDLDGLELEFVKKRKSNLPDACNSCMSNQIIGKFKEEINETAGTSPGVTHEAPCRNAC